MCSFFLVISKEKCTLYHFGILDSQELHLAHRQNDRAVMQAYAFPVKMTESECVAELFKLYTKLAES